MAGLPRSHPPQLVLLALLPPAFGAQLPVVADAAEALTGAQLGLAT